MKNRIIIAALLAVLCFLGITGVASATTRYKVNHAYGLLLKQEVQFYVAEFNTAKSSAENAIWNQAVWPTVITDGEKLFGSNLEKVFYSRPRTLTKEEEETKKYYSHPGEFVFVLKEGTFSGTSAEKQAHAESLSEELKTKYHQMSGPAFEEGGTVRPHSIDTQEFEKPTGTVKPASTECSFAETSISEWFSGASAFTSFCNTSEASIVGTTIQFAPAGTGEVKKRCSLGFWHKDSTGSGFLTNGHCFESEKEKRLETTTFSSYTKALTKFTVGKGPVLKPNYREPEGERKWDLGNISEETKAPPANEEVVIYDNERGFHGERIFRTASESFQMLPVTAHPEASLYGGKFYRGEIVCKTGQSSGTTCFYVTQYLKESAPLAYGTGGSEVKEMHPAAYLCGYIHGGDSGSGVYSGVIEPSSNSSSIVGESVEPVGILTGGEESNGACSQQFVSGKYSVALELHEPAEVKGFVVADPVFWYKSGTKIENNKSTAITISSGSTFWIENSSSKKYIACNETTGTGSIENPSGKTGKGALTPSTFTCGTHTLCPESTGTVAVRPKSTPWNFILFHEGLERFVNLPEIAFEVECKGATTTKKEYKGYDYPELRQITNGNFYWYWDTLPGEPLGELEDAEGEHVSIHGTFQITEPSQKIETKIE